MNKTISINLGGSVFNIEEDAFLKLRKYLDSIKANFVGDPAAEEIMQDIEVRIAELFNERMNERKNVVMASDVDEVIGIMGQPEDYKVESEDAQQNKQTNSGTRHAQRKLYRDEDDKIVGGVCAGLSHYFAVDPIVIRLIVVAIFLISGGTAILGYILFWALVPKAESTAEKLKMRGESVDINNITRMVNDEAKAAADRVNKYGQKAAHSIKNAAHGTKSELGRILGILFGFIVMLAGFGLLLGLLSAIIMSDFDFFGYGQNGFDTLNQLVFANDGTMWMLALGAALAIGAPAVALIYVGVRLITSTPKRIKGFGISLFALFVIGVALCMYGGISTAKQFSRGADIKTTAVLEATPADTLYVNVLTDSLFARSSRHDDEFGDLVKIVNGKIYYGEPLSVQFEPTRAKDYKVEIIKASQGRNNEEARTFCKNMMYDYAASKDSVNLSSYFTTPETDRYRGQNIDVTIYVPIGNYVHMGQGLRHISWYDRDGEVLRMEDDGLEKEEMPDWEQMEEEIRDDTTQASEEVTIKIDDGKLSIKKEVKERN